MAALAILYLHYKSTIFKPTNLENMLTQILPSGKSIAIDDTERTECEVYIRVIGYYRPVQNFNIGKRQEHRDRKYFTQPMAQKSALFDTIPT